MSPFYFEWAGNGKKDKLLQQTATNKCSNKLIQSNLLNSMKILDTNDSLLKFMSIQTEEVALKQETVTFALKN